MAGPDDRTDTRSLMDQAHWTAARYMQEGIAEIDKALGAGYAAANPVLLAAFMQTSAMDFQACYLKNALNKISITRK